MDEINNKVEDLGTEPTIFKELSKETQKELRKEFNKKTNADRGLIIASCIIAVSIIIIAISTAIAKSWSVGISMGPLCCVLVCLIALNEERFAKWLKAEKNIIMKRKK